MLDFLIVVDNICVLFVGWVFQQTIGIPMDTNCAPLLTDLFLHAYDAEFLQGLSRILAQTFNSIFRYIDDVLSLSNSRFCDYLHRIYAINLRLRILLILKSLLLTLTFILTSTKEED
jgi:hypothetical protein